MATKRRRAKAVRKEETVRFRASAEEKAALEHAASQDGLTLSTWLRRLALKSAGKLVAD